MNKGRKAIKWNLKSSFWVPRRDENQNSGRKEAKKAQEMDHNRNGNQGKYSSQ